MVFIPHSHAKIDGNVTLNVLGDPGAIAKSEDLVERTSTDSTVQEHRNSHANVFNMETISSV